MGRFKRVLIALVFLTGAGQASAVPITGANVLSVDGAEWAQVDLFTNLTWNQVNAVCPAGVCGSGTLGDYHMDGWTWASISDWLSLVDYYSNVATPPIVDVFRPTFGDNMRGWTSDAPVGFEFNSSGLAVGTHDLYFSPYPGGGVEFDFASSSFGLDPVSVANSQIGAWFYRAAEPPPNGVPTPATLGLFGLGLAGLGWTRRRRA